MNKKYDQEAFIQTLNKKCPSPSPCAFCGRSDFQVFDKFTNVPVQSNVGIAELGCYVPCGMVVCKNCGHINLFSLGVLGLMK